MTKLGPVDNVATGVLVACTLSVVVGCSEAGLELDASFSTPAGMAVAGRDHDLLFIANSGEDSLQALRWNRQNRGLGSLDFVRGPALYLPLRVPAGPNPRDVAAVPSGEYVVVLNAVGGTLRLFYTPSADQIAPAHDGDGDSRGTAIVLDLAAALNVDAGVLAGAASTGAEALPTAMVASPLECDRPCMGWVYVAVGGLGAVVRVQVRGGEAGGADSALEVDRIFDVGGSPAALAMHPDGRVLYATDSAADRLIRLDLGAGTIEQVPIGAPGSAVAVSRDGRVVVVGRPALRDLLLLRQRSGLPLTILDANSMFAPVPACVADCDDAADRPCDSPHAAELSVCRSADGLRPVEGLEYRAVFLGKVPARILTLGAPADVGDSDEQASAPGLAIPCTPDGGGSGYIARHGQFAVVAALDGHIRFVSLAPPYVFGTADTYEDEVGLVSYGYCRSASLGIAEKAILPFSTVRERRSWAPLADLLEPCPEHPSGRRQYACVSASPAAAAGLPEGDSEAPTDPDTPVPGVVLVRGQGSLASRTWDLEWEGVVHRVLNREDGGGLVGQDGRFTDLFLDLGNYDIQPEARAPDGEVTYRGDILQILTAPLVSEPRCEEALGTDEPRRCLLERRIVSMDEQGDSTWLGFGEDGKLPESCFSGGGVIQYRVRVGDQFMVTTATEERLRVRPGAIFGVGSDVGADQGLSFRLKDVDIPDWQSLHACDRYDDTGHAKEGSWPDVLSRDRSAAFLVSDPFGQVAAGLEPLSTSVTPVGRLPAGMVAWSQPDSTTVPAVFVTYSASNSLYGFVPFEPDRLSSDDSLYRILR